MFLSASIITIPKHISHRILRLHSFFVRADDLSWWWTWDRASISCDHNHRLNEAWTWWSCRWLRHLLVALTCCLRISWGESCFCDFVFCMLQTVRRSLRACSSAVYDVLFRVESNIYWDEQLSGELAAGPVSPSSIVSDSMLHSVSLCDSFYTYFNFEMIFSTRETCLGTCWCVLFVLLIST